MFLLSVKPSPREDKRYMATYCLCEKKNACKGTNHKKVHFGQPGATTYVDGASEKTRDAYEARHKVNENWTDPTKPGTLAKYLLWWKPTLRQAIAGFKGKFKV